MQEDERLVGQAGVGAVGPGGGRVGAPAGRGEGPHPHPLLREVPVVVGVEVEEEGLEERRDAAGHAQRAEAPGAVDGLRGADLGEGL